ncbi:MAG: hypothetical protein EU539_09455 [Promethearchaeota archaeon]|nr:MAG: hypothetical protein EU539_09455 [Candidatus Lokiarchaeota archaeon]
MNDIKLLKSYNLIKINASPEIWLKSMKVRIRMLKTLMNNIKRGLNKAQVKFNKYQLSKDSSRIFFFFKNKDIQAAARVLDNIFGIESYSPALRTSDNIINITKRTIEVCEEILSQNDSFALRVKRSGVHEYTSLEVAEKVGKAVLEQLAHLNLKVNLSNPDKTIFIEVRNDFSYVYTDIVKNYWGGLPIEDHKKVVCMDVSRIHDLMAGFLVMRRGCRIFPILFLLTENEKVVEFSKNNWKEVLKFIPLSSLNIKVINIVDILKKIKQNVNNPSTLCALCRLVRFDIISRMLNDQKAKEYDNVKAITDGVSLNNLNYCSDEVDLQSMALNYLFSQYPIFTPIVAFDEAQLKEFLTNISRKLKMIDYCQFKPQNQTIDIKELKTLYKSLNLNDLILEVLNKTKLYQIS